MDEHINNFGPSEQALTWADDQDITILIAAKMQELGMHRLTEDEREVLYIHALQFVLKDVLDLLDNAPPLNVLAKLVELSEYKLRWAEMTDPTTCPDPDTVDHDVIILATHVGIMQALQMFIERVHRLVARHDQWHTDHDDPIHPEYS